MISSYEIIEKYSVLVEKHSIKNQLEEYSDSLYTTVDNVYRTYDSTGFPALDPYLKKKDCPVGQLITIGARPSIGKTAFAVSLTLHITAMPISTGWAVNVSPDFVHSLCSELQSFTMASSEMSGGSGVNLKALAGTLSTFLLSSV